MNCIIIEDEPLAQKVLQNYISKSQNLYLKQVFGNALLAADYLNRHKVDLIFLDIHLPQWSGIEFYKSIQNKPLLIFTTAYQEFAVEGFALNAVDYLLKPFDFDRFNQAVLKAQKQFNLNEKKQYITVKADRKQYRLACSDIYFIEAMGDYIKIHTPHTTLISKDSLKSFGAQLPKELFIQVHRSFIVNAHQIEVIEKNQLRCLGQNIPIGGAYKTNLEIF